MRRSPCSDALDPLGSLMLDTVPPRLLLISKVAEHPLPAGSSGNPQTAVQLLFAFSKQCTLQQISSNTRAYNPCRAPCGQAYSCCLPHLQRRASPADQQRLTGCALNTCARTVRLAQVCCFPWVGYTHIPMSTAIYNVSCLPVLDLRRRRSGRLLRGRGAARRGQGHQRGRPGHCAQQLCAMGRL